MFFHFSATYQKIPFWKSFLNPTSTTTEETQTQTGTDPTSTDPTGNASSTHPTQSPGYLPDPKTQSIVDLNGGSNPNF